MSELRLATSCGVNDAADDAQDLKHTRRQTKQKTGLDVDMVANKMDGALALAVVQIVVAGTVVVGLDWVEVDMTGSMSEDLAFEGMRRSSSEEESGRMED
jgi:hypothetical protein